MFQKAAELVVDQLHNLTRAVLPLSTVWVENADQAVFAAAAAHEKLWGDFKVIVGTPDIDLADYRDRHFTGGDLSPGYPPPA